MTIFLLNPMNLYWQKKYNPEQFKTPSTFQLGCKPGNRIGYYAKRFYKYVMNIMGKKTKYDMIPVEQWMATNPNIAKAQEEWFEMDMVNIQSKADDSIVHLLLD